jgi:hypothetical protein
MLLRPLATAEYIVQSTDQSHSVIRLGCANGDVNSAAAAPPRRGTGHHATAAYQTSPPACLSYLLRPFATSESNVDPSHSAIRLGCANGDVNSAVAAAHQARYRPTRYSRIPELTPA